jgi:hypothetical protein
LRPGRQAARAETTNRGRAPWRCVSHTPTTPATDDRPLRFLEKAEVEAAHRERLLALVRLAQELAEHAGQVDKLQCEFGAEHAGMIHDCNQFMRLYKRGPAVGRVEFFLPPEAKAKLGQSFTLQEPLGAVFKLFGWVSVDPMEGDWDALKAALAAAYQKARAKK